MTRRKIGLVLSGGMGKGAYQIGSLTAVREMFAPEDFNYVSAASVGALNTYAFLTENLPAARSMWDQANQDGDRKFITRILKSDYLKQCIEDLITDRPIPTVFYVPLLDVDKRNLDYYDLSGLPREKLYDYLCASVAMPYYNKGVEIDGKTLFDGAVVDNIPVYPLLRQELDLLICVYFDNIHYIFEDHNQDHKIIRVTFPDKGVISNSVNIKHESILAMMDEGYRRTKEILSYIFQNPEEDLSGLYERIRQSKQIFTQTEVRVTGDVVVTNMNRVFRKLLRKRTIIE